MTKLPNLANYWENAVEMSMMMVEAHSVINMRVMGMAGLWSVGPGENNRMVSEKLEAMVKATTDAGNVTLRGGSPDEIAAAAIAPMRNATRSNSKRLTKRGMKKG
ncbi:hypothetical protein [Pseudorhodobacter ferrugineus]|uniref:hypothetical protein n=1 Tax=Pseudorhodobacter ferrugineus TaxID=77008 RepID=UPI0003B4F70B|nr:hypothetical protein [Pseudorhodobacter ferrugineus]